MKRVTRPSLGGGPKLTASGIASARSFPRLNRARAVLLSAVVGLALVLGTPAGSAASAEYRSVGVPPVPPSPQGPAVPPVPPCTITGFVIDCSPVGTWAAGEIQKPVEFVNSLSLWVNDGAQAAGQVAQPEFTFVGTGSSTTIHLHDDVAAGIVHENVLFVVKGGPAGAQWTCRHICTVPDTSIVVSINPLSVPPEDWVSPTLAFPPVTGLIDVTFNP